MEDQSPLTSLAGSRKRNPPERCLRPLYSQDSAQEEHTISQHGHVDGMEPEDMIVIKEEEEEVHIMGEERRSEEELSPQISTDPEETPGEVKDEPAKEEAAEIKQEVAHPKIPCYSRHPAHEEHRSPYHHQDEGLDDVKSEIKDEAKTPCVRPEEPYNEEDTAEISEGGSTHRERYRRPLYHQDSMKEEPRSPHCYQGENLIDVKAEEKAEAGEADVRWGEPRVKGEAPPESRTGGEYQEKGPVTPPDTKLEEDDITSDSSEDYSMSPSLKPVQDGANLPADPSTVGGVLPGGSSSITKSKARVVRGTFPCPDCEERFSDEEDLISHQASHQEKKFSCSKCGKCFTNRLYFSIHEKVHRTGRSLSCNECGRTFKWVENLIVHEKTHLLEQPFQCPECGKCFDKRYKYSRHMKSHKGENPLSCPDCGQSFPTKRMLIEHQRFESHSPFLCSECGKYFASRGDIIRHKRDHVRERPFACSECGKCFAVRNTLVKHQKTHSVEKPFSCVVCGKAFIQRYLLTSHKCFPIANKPFSCSECEKRFTTKRNLLMHAKVHTGERPYVCSECGKSCLSKSNLSVHQRIHTGVYPHTCPDCGQHFTNKSRLKSHLACHNAGDHPGLVCKK